MTDQAPGKQPGNTKSGGTAGQDGAACEARNGSQGPLPRPFPGATGCAQPRWILAEIVDRAPGIKQDCPQAGRQAELPRVMRVAYAPGAGGFVNAPHGVNTVARPARSASTLSSTEPLSNAGDTEIAFSPEGHRNSRGFLGRVVIGTAKAAAIVFLIWFVAMFALIGLFRSVNPPASALMALRAADGTMLRHTWVDLKSISPHLVRAVIVSEDGRFCRHWGIDLKEVEAAIERANGGTPRGASTISMQVAKNLFLWPDKSYIRKALEVPLTLGIEAMWPKKRIVEVYLNFAEWGPGLFGAEAAARHHFGKPARQLNIRQAALMAAALPNPIRRRAGKPGRTTSRLAQRLQSRVRQSRWAANCVLGPRAEQAKRAKD